MASGKTRVDRAFSIDTERGFVMFGEPIVRLGGTAGSDVKNYPAKLRLRTSVTIRDPETLGIVRHERSRKLSGPKFDTKPQYISREEIFVGQRFSYRNDSFVNPGILNNLVEVNKIADKILDLREASFESQSPETVTYAGLVPVELDGALQSVSYSITKSATLTMVNRNHDLGRNMISHKERRTAEQSASIGPEIAVDCIKDRIGVRIHQGLVAGSRGQFFQQVGAGGVRCWRFEKGGFGGLAFSAAMQPKLSDQLAHRVMGETGCLSNFFLGLLVDEDCPQRFVASLIGLRWLFEELAISRIVHDLASEEM